MFSVCCLHAAGSHSQLLDFLTRANAAAFVQQTPKDAAEGVKTAVYAATPRRKPRL